MTYPEQQESQHLPRLAVLIPAWQPEERLTILATDLVAQGFGAVIVVDDGSDKKCSTLFDELAHLPSVHVLRHAVNLGKGRALKMFVAAEKITAKQALQIGLVECVADHPMAEAIRRIRS